jgi:hypothetical protein
VTPSHLGAMNDKSIVRFYEFVMRIRDSQVYADLEFKLYAWDIATNEVIEITMTGGYLISDGGYHKWRCLKCPFKHPATNPRLWFSKRLESVRKDIEGIMKKRFQILKCPIQFHYQETIDSVFLHAASYIICC